LNGNLSLTLADALKSLRDDVQAENTLVAGRVTWYVTSQAFLLTAYATSWSAGFMWPNFFHVALPVVAIVLSMLILASVYAATWAQDVYLREQQILVTRIEAEMHLSPQERLALQFYERTLVGNRTNARGTVVGPSIHALVRITPLVLPLGFAALWLYAYFFAPYGAT
jgi:hypothetical protein